MVRSQIVKANGEPVKVDYMMRRNGEGWLISDIYLDGAISEVATRRSEFAAILRTDGVDGLIAALNRKADILTGWRRPTRPQRIRPADPAPCHPGGRLRFCRRLWRGKGVTV